MDPSSVNTDTFFLRKKGSIESIPSTISYTPLDSTNSIPPYAILKPNDPLEYSTDYTVTLTSGIQSKDGISLSPVQWDFKTTQNPDTTPPQFDGLDKATMKNAGTITLEWNPATDPGGSDPKDIVYEICFTLNEPGLCEGLFGTNLVNMKTSDPGATSNDVTGLPIQTDIYFLVRAKDQAGNLDQNNVELQASITINLGRLYAANGNGREILAYKNPTRLNGNASFDARISAKQTTLGNPNGLFVDNNRKELYVTNFLANTVAVYDITDPLAPGPYPKRVISGPDTKLSGPTGIFVDITSDPRTLYVTNIISDSIVIFNNANTISGNVTPDITIEGDQTLLDDPQGIAVRNSDIYVANTEGHAILIFNEADASTTPNLQPEKMIRGTNTGLAAPVGLALSPTQVYIANRNNNSITAYDLANIQTCTTDECLEGDLPPAKQIIKEIDADGNTVSDSTGLSIPRQIFLDLQDPFDAFGKLYVSNTGDNTVLIFDQITNPETDGNVVSKTFPNAPSLRIKGPRGIAINRGFPSNNYFLFLASQESHEVLIFSLRQPSVLNPIATLSPIKTQLTNPLGTYLDSRDGSLYVTNYFGNSIMVFESAHLTTNNLTPSRVIQGSNTKLDGPTGIFVDETNDILYVANFNDSSVLSFEKASTASGNIAPARDIRGFLSRIFIPIDLFIAPDPDNPGQELLFVCNRGGDDQTTVPPEILIFENAREVGNTISSPARILAGPNTGLNTPIGIFVDTLNDLIYVSNREGDLPQGGSIAVFSDATSIDGDQPPDRIYHFKKNNQRFEIRPNGITVQNLVNENKNRIYFANEGTPESVFGVLSEGRKIPPSIITFEEDLNSPGQGTLLHPISAMLQIGTQPLTSQNFANRPYGIAVDIRSGINDSLYVADYLANSVSVFSGASTLSSTGIISSVPNTKIPFTLESPRWLALDSLGDELFVSSYANNALVAFRTASQTTDEVIPLKIIKGENTQIDKPQGIALVRERDETTFDLTLDRLYLANEGSASILAFDDITHLNGDISPTFEITSGALTSSSKLRGLAYSKSSDLLYVSDIGGNIYIFDGLSTINTSISLNPLLTLTSSDLPMDQPVGLYLEEVNDAGSGVSERLYIADFGNSHVVVVDLKVSTDSNSNKILTLLNFRTIASSLSSDIYPVGVLIHSGLNHLYVSSFPQNNLSQQVGSINVFKDASTANGFFAQIQKIEGDKTGLNLPFGLALDTTR